jgi:hypothetical protein
MKIQLLIRKLEDCVSNNIVSMGSRTVPFTSAAISIYQLSSELAPQAGLPGFSRGNTFFCYQCGFHP